MSQELLHKLDWVVFGVAEPGMMKLAAVVERLLAVVALTTSMGLMVVKECVLEIAKGVCILRSVAFALELVEVDLERKLVM